MKKEELKKIKSELENKSKSINLQEQNFMDFEDSAKKKFNDSIKGFVNHKKYENIKDYLNLITNESKINCFILKSNNGLGKTTIIKNILKDLNRDFLYINSYTTSLAFYKMVYHNRYKTIILDDVFGLYSDEKGISILRALTNTESVRLVNYQTTSDKLNVPSSFIFEGSIIVLTNKITDEMDKSLLGRAIFRKIKFSLEEKIEFVDKIIKFQYGLNDSEVKEIMNFIKDNVDKTTINFTFRTALKVVEFFKHNKDKWKDLAKEELEKDKMLVLVQNLIRKYSIVDKQIETFIKETGKSRRTFFRLKRKLGIKCQSVKVSNDKKDSDSTSKNTQKCQSVKVSDMPLSDLNLKELEKRGVF